MNAKTKYKLIVGETAINTAIKSIASRGRKMDHDIQVLCLSIHSHTAEHGDYTGFNRLYNALPQGSRRNTYIKWVEVTTFCDWDTKEKVFRKNQEKGMLPTEDAAEMLWYEAEREPEYKSFNPESFLKALGKRLSTASEHGEPVEDYKRKLFEGVREIAGLTADEETRNMQGQLSELARQLAEMTSQRDSLAQVVNAGKPTLRKGARGTRVPVADAA